jgi:hypothetical protein
VPQTRHKADEFRLAYGRSHRNADQKLQRFRCEKLYFCVEKMQEHRRAIIGAMSRLTVLARKSIQEGSWLARLLHRKPLMLVAIALANKMARAIWAMMTKKEDYRDPARAVSA